MAEAERICALLIASGWVRRNDIRDLEDPQIRTEVEARLRSCGLSLATSAYSDYYGLRLASEICDATVLDTPTNLDLSRDACALLTVLWARLALQRRTAEDTHDAPTMQTSLLPLQRGEQARRSSRNSVPGSGAVPGCVLSSADYVGWASSPTTTWMIFRLVRFWSWGLTGKK